MRSALTAGPAWQDRFAQTAAKRSRKTGKPARTVGKTSSDLSMRAKCVSFLSLRGTERRGNLLKIELSKPELRQLKRQNLLNE